MKILFLTQIIPFPPNAGPRVKTWHVLNYLVQQGHDVTLASFVRQDEIEFVPVLETLCHEVHTIPIHRSRTADVGHWLKSHLSKRPFLIERDDLKPMRQLVQRLLNTHPFDLVHADQLTMTQFALDVDQLPQEKRPYIIFDAHNATWTIWERMRQNAPLPLKPIYKMEEDRIKRYEAMLVERFNHTMVVIDPDREALLEGVPRGRWAQLLPRMSSIPIAIDAQKLQPTHRQPNSCNIMTLGSLNYPPNADGIRWFMEEIFPQIRQHVPEVTLTVIGKNPPADFIDMANRSQGQIEVTGYVDDLTPYMEAAALMVVPVRAGSGMRVRLLEAFARAMPAVTTTIGLEGIHATHGCEILVADEVHSFAHECVRLLRNPKLQQQLAENGRLLAQSKYDWRVVLRQMDKVYQQAQKGLVHAK